MPGQLMPSIPVDEFEDDHAFMAHAVQLWAQGEEAELIRTQRPENYANVIAWGKGHAQMIPPPPGPEGEAPAAGPPPPGAPPESAPLQVPPQG